MGLIRVLAEGAGPGLGNALQEIATTWTGVRPDVVEEAEIQRRRRTRPHVAATGPVDLDSGVIVVRRPRSAPDAPQA